jgi:hypothetical protein
MDRRDLSVVTCVEELWKDQVIAAVNLALTNSGIILLKERDLSSIERRGA